jgi:long-chain acyl-CoA synthetase
MKNTLLEYLDQWAVECPDKVWLRDRKGDEFTSWTWSVARTEIHAVAAALESRFGGGGRNIGIL